VITIRKYPNRRLYDASRSRYVNLEDVAELVRQGHELRVLDSRTGDDLTREVFLQVVLEVLAGQQLLPVGMLRRMIRYSGESPLHRSMQHQLTAMLEAMSGQLDRMEALLGGLGKPPPPDPGEGPPEPPPEEGPKAGPQRDPEEDAGADDELKELRARLAGLEQRLKRR
jgi:polyhydroxyalkanoate synthesis repressor PhaR